jgi:hypothetical protein
MNSKRQSACFHWLGTNIGTLSADHLPLIQLRVTGQIITLAAELFSDTSNF